MGKFFIALVFFYENAFFILPYYNYQTKSAVKGLAEVNTLMMQELGYLRFATTELSFERVHTSATVSPRTLELCLASDKCDSTFNNKFLFVVPEYRIACGMELSVPRFTCSSGDLHCNITISTCICNTN